MSYKKILFISLLLQNPLFISVPFSAEDTSPEQETPKRRLTRSAHINSSTLLVIEEEKLERVNVAREARKKSISLRLTDTKEAKKSENDFEVYFTYIGESIRKCHKKKYEHLSKLIIYSYPFFINEDKLFKFLITEKEKFSAFITVFLRQLALEAFPNGPDNFYAADNSFNSLKVGLIDDPIFSCFRQNRLKSNYLDINTLPKLSTEVDQKVWYERWNVIEIIEMLTQRDINLYCAISFSDLVSNLKNQSSPPSSILAINSHFDRTIRWICFEILKKKDPRERSKMIHLFSAIGRTLYQNKNFHGVSQIVLAFAKIQISRILSPQEEEKLMKEEFMNNINPQSNYKKYRDLLSYPSSNSFEIQILPVFFRDILFSYETKSIESIGRLMELFTRSQKFLCPKTTFGNDDQDVLKLNILKFLSQLPDIPDTTLDELSSLIVKWDCPRENQLPQNLEGWNMSHFYTFLVKHDEKLIMQKLFDNNIYNGADFVSFLKNCSSFEELNDKFDHIGFTGTLRKELLDEVQLKLSDFMDLPVLVASEIKSENSDFKRKPIAKSKTSRRQSNLSTRESKAPAKKRLSLNLPEINQDSISISPRRTIKYEKEKASIFSGNVPMLSFSEVPSFWDIYLAYTRNKIGIYDWGRMEGALLSTIKRIADQWKAVVPDREPTFNVNLFLLKRTAMFESFDSQKRDFRHKVIKVDYSLPVSFPTFNRDNVLTIYFEVAEHDHLRVMKGVEESPIELINRLELWKNNDGKTFKDILKKLESKKPMPYTPHDFSRPRIIEISDMSPKKFIKLYYNREKRILDFGHYQFQPEEFFSLLSFLPKDMVVLNMSHTGIRKADVLSLSPFLSHTLLELNLSNNRIGDVALMTLGQNIPRNLEILDLSHNRIGDVGIFSICQNLPGTLKKLFLKGNKITSKGVERLFSSLQNQLLELDLSHTLIDDATFLNITPEQRFPHFLNLSYTKIGDKSLITLLRSGFKGLSWINLEGTDVGEKGRLCLGKNGFFLPLSNFQNSLWHQNEWVSEVNF